MINAPHSQIILASNNDAKDLGITGTPAFFIIGPDGKVTRIFGAQPYEVFENIFEIELKKQK
jgi:predicted DsbA family dithiol-disulfide isomerase